MVHKRHKSYLKLRLICWTLKIQPTAANSPPSKFRFFTQINRGADLRVHFDIVSQWSVPEKLYGLSMVPNYSGDKLTVVDCNRELPERQKILLS